MTAIVATDSPRIYVACLAAYNNGTLHGEWIDLAGKDADDVHDEIQKMLETSPEHDPDGIYGPAEEWAIHDYDCFGGIAVSEHDSIERVVTIAELIEEHGAPLLAWMDSKGSSADPTDYDPDTYLGTYEDAESWAWESAEEQIDKVNALLGPGHCFRFDAADYVLHHECDGYTFAEYGGRTFVFSS